MSSLASVLVGRGFLQALYTSNMLWHTSAFYHFTFLPEHIMHKLSLRRNSPNSHIASTSQGDVWHHDFMAYLGGINIGYVVLAAFRLYALSRAATAEDPYMDVVALTVLAVGNASQAVLNFSLSPRSGRWIMGTGFDRITVLDALFAVLDGSVVTARLLGY